ncbi:metal-dependent hydrolase, partial [Burkholderia pseudomallei]
MASHAAHHASGWAAGLVAAALVAQAGAAGPWHVYSLAAFAAGVA